MRKALTQNAWTEIGSGFQCIQNIGDNKIYLAVASSAPTSVNEGLELKKGEKVGITATGSDKVYAYCNDSGHNVEVITEKDFLNVEKRNDFFLDIAKGEYPNMSYIEKFGENPEITTSTHPEDVWGGGGLYNFSSTADITKIASSDNGDNQEIVIYGLDENWEEVEQIVTLTGQTPVTLATALIRVYRMINNGSTDMAGVVRLATSSATFSSGVPTDLSTVRAVINNGNNQTLMAIYSVPAGKTAYFLGGYVAMSRGPSSATFVEMTWRARLFGKVFAVKSRIDLQSDGKSSWQYRYPIPVALPEKSDVLIRCEEVGGTMGISGGFTILLIDN